MNLYTPGDGLFRTHVTLEDIEQDLRQAFGTTASFGVNMSVEDIGENKGYMSKIILVKPDWQSLEKGLPQKVLVKIPTQLVMQKFQEDVALGNNRTNRFKDHDFRSRFELNQKRCHNAEVAVYEHLAKVPDGKLFYPKIYCMRKFTESNPGKGYIAMEFLENIKEVQIFENISIEQMKQILRFKAVLEASSFDISSEDRMNFVTNPFENVWNVMFKDELISNVTTRFRTFNGGELAKRADRLAEIFDNMVDLHWADHLANTLGMERVLCHGDLWSMNILWRQDGDQLNLATLVDYQVAHFGCTATDLVRLFSATLSGKDRRAYWEELLEEYYGYVKKEIGDRKMPYTIEQLKEAYRQFFPMGAYLIVPAIVPLFEMACGTHAEEWKKEIVTEKCECLLDDMLFYHDRNMKMKESRVAMNLYTPGEGLFDTHVTWDDIEADMQNELSTVASFGPNKSAKDIGEGNGFMSKILLIEPDWQNKDKELPKQFLAKILTQLAIQKLSTKVAEQSKIDNHFTDPEFKIKFEEIEKRCHNAEVTAYSHLIKIPKVKITVPEIYCMKKFSESNPAKGYILMEHLDNIKGIHIFENISIKEVREILHYLAVIEASSLRIPKEERAGFIDEPFKTVFGAMLEDEVMDRIYSMFHSLDNGRLADRADRLKEIKSEMVDIQSIESLSEHLGMERVLCHGDLWSMNILWRQNGDEHHLAALVDYQVSHFGCAATDLVRMFSACLSGKDRREHWEELLEVFYGYLKEEVGNGKMPYTLEQLKEAYRRFFPVGAFLIVPLIGPLFECVFKNPDEEMKKKV
nr:Uncharacterised kinase D1044.1 domain containing protein [Haemonchus contortus]